MSKKKKPEELPANWQPQPSPPPGSPPIKPPPPPDQAAPVVDIEEIEDYQKSQGPP